MLLTIAELPEYLRSATRLLADGDRRAIIDHLAANPTAGDLIEGTGGMRKLRWAQRPRQEWRCAGGLLLPQRGYAAVSVDDVCQE